MEKNFNTSSIEVEISDNASVQAYKIIKQMILSQRLAHGSVTSVSALCKEINIGRTPVTIACQHLDSEGFLSIIPKQGILIHSLSLNESIEIYEFRAVLEEYSARKTCEMYNTCDFEFLEAVFDRQKAAAENADSFTFMVEDRAFHTFFVNKLGNQQIISSHALLYDRTFSTGTFNIKNPERMISSINEHRVIIDALRDKDYDLFVNSTRQHVLNGLSSLFNAYNFKA